MKKILSNSLTILLVACFLTSCGGGSSSSGGVEETAAGDMLPEAFVGVYTGTLSYEAELDGPISLSDSGTEAIVITVNANGTIVIEVDGETVSTGITNQGDFAANLQVESFVEECEGVVGAEGSVDGTTASGTFSGEADCEEGVLSASAELTGSFTATK